VTAVVDDRPKLMFHRDAFAMAMESLGGKRQWATHDEITRLMERS
jgi:hypothetical protein